MVGWKKFFGLFVVFVVVFFVFVVVRVVIIIEMEWGNVIIDFGIELIFGYLVIMNVIILISFGEFFVLSSYMNVDMFEVIVKFVDEYGNVFDMNGDSVVDVYFFMNILMFGFWIVIINVLNVILGVYIFKIEVFVKNSISGEIVDNVIFEFFVWIVGGLYWVVVVDIKDGDIVEIGSFEFIICGFFDFGVILDFGNLSIIMIMDDDCDGIFIWKNDVMSDGVDDWIVFVKSDDDSDRYVMMVYFSDVNFFDDFNFEDKFEVRSDDGRVKFMNKVFKEYNNYKVYVVWDESFFVKFGIKVVDYYIIFLKGREYWKEGFGNVDRIDVKVIKRIIYFWGLFGNEEEVYSGNIFNKNVNIDDIIIVFGKWVGNWVRFVWG